MLLGEKLCGRDTVFFLSLRHSSAMPTSTLLSSHFAVGLSKPHKFPILSMAIKRSPKRLKYTSPRFTKVLFTSLYLYPFLTMVFLASSTSFIFIVPCQCVYMQSISRCGLCLSGCTYSSLS